MAAVSCNYFTVLPLSFLRQGFVTRHLSSQSSLNKFLSLTQQVEKDGFFSFSDKANGYRDELLDHFHLLPKFISVQEEANLLKDAEKRLCRQPYQADHWDAAIGHYRETESVVWGPESSDVLARIQKRVFDIDSSKLSSDNSAILNSPVSQIHVLDLAAEGVIRPHVDSIRHCGDTIAGLSLLSDSVMRLVHTSHPECKVDILLPRLSLYIMQGPPRYEYTHEVLEDKESVFKGFHIMRSRRVSIICRNSP